MVESWVDQDSDAAVDMAVALVEHCPAVQAHQKRPAVARFNIQLHFSSPYGDGSGLGFLATPTIANLTEVFAHEYFHRPGDGVVD